MALAFDTLKYAKKLEVAGVTRKQAEAQAEATAEVLHDLVSDTIATKKDVTDVRTELKEVKAELKQDIADLRAELKQDIADLRTELKQDIANVKVDMIKWMIGLLFAQTALILTVLKYAH